MTARPALRVALVGHAFMGRAHSQAWARLDSVYDLPVRVHRAVLCGREIRRTTEAAQRLGWADATDDWRVAVERDDIDVVDICTPVSSHAEIAVAALAAGKHVLCEKPLALTGDDAAVMAEAAAGSGGRAMIGFNYRRVPAVALLARLVADGRLGRVQQLRLSYDQDWGCDPSVPLTWRFRAAEGGSGVLADLGSHLVDLAVFLTGVRVSAVVGATQQLVPRRPAEQGTHALVDVDVEDSVAFLARMASGAVASVTASRNVPGRKNALQLQLAGDGGTATFDLERPNELSLYSGNDPADTAGFRTVVVTERDHPYLGAWWPPGHVLGWEHTFVHELHDFVRAISDGHQPEPGFAQGLHVQRVLDTVLAARERWTGVPDGTV